MLIPKFFNLVHSTELSPPARVLTPTQSSRANSTALTCASRIRTWVGFAALCVLDLRYIRSRTT